MNMSWLPALFEHQMPRCRVALSVVFFINCNLSNYYTFGFIVGYTGAWLLLVAIAHLILMPFGYGYVGSELMGAYCLWSTIRQWDIVLDEYRKGVSLY